MVPPDCLVLFTKINPTNSLQLQCFCSVAVMASFCHAYSQSTINTMTPSSLNSKFFKYLLFTDTFLHWPRVLYNYKF